MEAQRQLDDGRDPVAAAEPIGEDLVFARVLPDIDRFVSRATGRRATLAGLVTGLQVLLLTTTGAKTGTQWTTPVLYLRQAEDFVLVAGNWGQRHNPSWYYNLRANPRAKVTVCGSTHDVITREVTGPQRNLLWQQACRMYPAYRAYQARAPHREFPIMVLSQTD